MFWNWLTRFGDSTLLLPLATLGAFGVGDASRRWAASIAWLLPLGVATAAVLASKIAFLGFGLGIPALDFTGASGHAMAAFACYPLFAYVLTRAQPRPWRVLAMCGALVLATSITMSRVAIGAHSAAECWGGALCGAVAAATSIAWLRTLPRAVLAPGWWWLVLGVLVVATPAAAPAPSHALVSRLALYLSGRSTAYERADLHAPIVDPASLAR